MSDTRLCGCIECGSPFHVRADEEDRPLCDRCAAKVTRAPTAGATLPGGQRIGLSPGIDTSLGGGVVVLAGFAGVLGLVVWMAWSVGTSMFGESTSVASGPDGVVDELRKGAAEPRAAESRALPPRRWVRVGEWSGTSREGGGPTTTAKRIYTRTRQSVIEQTIVPPFRSAHGQIRVRWEADPHASSAGYFGMAIEDGNAREIHTPFSGTVAGPLGDTYETNDGLGDFGLVINAMKVNWSVLVEEFR